jgi:hypothetical protein
MILTRSVSKVVLPPASLPLSAPFRALVKDFLALVTLALLCASFSRAQATYTAASSNESDVQAAANKVSAAGGDTVNVPCSPATAVWTTALTSTHSFTLNFQGSTPNTGAATFGSGANCVTIQDANASGPIIELNPAYQSGQVVVIQNVNIDPVSPTTALWSPISIAGTCTSSGCPQIRINNVVFGNSTQWNEAGNSSNADTMIRADNVFGVIDHNTLPTGSRVVFANINHSAYLGTGGYGDNSWAQADTFGGANNLFLENNNIYVGGVSATDAEFAPIGGGIGGGRQVDRYNQITSNNGFGVFGLHGLDTDGRPRSGRQLEVYGNNITCTNNSCNIIAGYRGGTGFTWGNTITNTGTGFFNTFFNISVYRIMYQNNPFGYCGGLTSLDPWDTVDNAVYYSGTMSASGGSLTLTDGSKTFSNLTPNGAPYSVYDTTQGFVSEIVSNTATTITIVGPISESGWTGFNNGDSYKIVRATVCVDQGGRGQGSYVSGSGSSPAGPLSQALDPIYEWGDSESPIRLNQNAGSDTGRIIANRDWYTDNSSGTPHVQASPTAPFNGTSGVGFGTLANRPATCTPYVGYFATDQGNWNQSGSGTQGELFTCTATNTWTLHYEPYTYPHPLVAGNTTSNNPPQPPTNLNATVN